MFLDKGERAVFSFEAQLPPPPQSSSKRREVCQAYQSGSCRNGDQCPERHVITQLRSMQHEVCKHWLRGACVVNGDNCLYLHEYEERFVPECAFYQRIGECTNPECPFRHTPPSEKQPLCAAYLRGFCPRGPNCKLRHQRKDACPFYLAGFCPLGPRCKLGHPAQILYDRQSVFSRLQQQLQAERVNDPSFNINVTCYKCFDPGHIPKNCPGVPYGHMYKLQMAVQEPGERPTFLPEGRVNGRFCFFCGEEGHEVKNCTMRQNRGGGGGGGGGGFR